MRVKKSAVLLLCAALLPLSGCSRAEAALPYAHEIEDTVLMGALGVDLEEGARGGGGGPRPPGGTVRRGGLARAVAGGTLRTG